MISWGVGGQPKGDGQVCEAQFRSSPSAYSVHVFRLSFFSSISVAVSLHTFSTFFFHPRSCVFVFFLFFFSIDCWSVVIFL